MYYLLSNGRISDDYLLGRSIREKCSTDGDFEKLLVPTKKFENDFSGARGIPSGLSLKAFFRDLFSVPLDSIRLLNPQEGLPPGCLIVETPWFDTWIPYQWEFSYQTWENFEPYSHGVYVHLERFIDISDLFFC